MRIIYLCCLILFSTGLAQAQSGRKFVPGYVVDIKGNRMTGLIQSEPSGRSPIKNQAFIVFKENDKANKQELTAGSIQYFVAGRDSFVVASAPREGYWSKYELDFVQVLADEPVKIYALRDAAAGGSGVGVVPSIGLGMGVGGGGGHFGFGGGGGVGLSIGGFGGGGHKTVYYVGSTPAEITQIIPENFVDVMSDVMNDEPQIVEEVQNGKYHLNRIEPLIYEYYRTKAQQQKNGQQPQQPQSQQHQQ